MTGMRRLYWCEHVEPGGESSRNWLDRMWRHTVFAAAAASRAQGRRGIGDEKRRRPVVRGLKEKRFVRKLVGERPVSQLEEGRGLRLPSCSRT